LALGVGVGASHPNHKVFTNDAIIMILIATFLKTVCYCNLLIIYNFVCNKILLICYVLNIILLDEGFVISKIIKVEVGVIS